MSEKRKLLLTVVLFGSVWGGLEALVSAASQEMSFVMPRSIILAFIAIVMLTSARLLLPKSGTTLAVGLVAAGFKLLSLPDLLACQIAAVIGQAAILEIAFGLAKSGKWLDRPALLAVTVVVASYLNSITFGFSQAYLFHNQFWLDRGVTGLLNWSFGTGSAAALASVIGALLAYALVHRRNESWDALIERRTAAVVRSAIAISLCSWLVGLLVVTP
jgi:hypothetical protein